MGQLAGNKSIFIWSSETIRDTFYEEIVLNIWKYILFSECL